MSANEGEIRKRLSENQTWIGFSDNSVQGIVRVGLVEEILDEARADFPMVVGTAEKLSEARMFMGNTYKYPIVDPVKAKEILQAMCDVCIWFERWFGGAEK